MIYQIVKPGKNYLQNEEVQFLLISDIFSYFGQTTICM